MFVDRCLPNFAEARVHKPFARNNPILSLFRSSRRPSTAHLAIGLHPRGFPRLNTGGSAKQDATGAGGENPLKYLLRRRAFHPMMGAANSDDIVVRGGWEFLNAPLDQGECTPCLRRRILRCRDHSGLRVETCAASDKRCETNG